MFRPMFQAFSTHEKTMQVGSDFDTKILSIILQVYTYRKIFISIRIRDTHLLNRYLQSSFGTA